ncbi:hypothetical protein [Pseudorhodoplanes sp.]|uniref:hypothetical protein n=1 Tax=Pseudorhodoplanes sp. TaxID=1934341 RepID=UPI003D137CF8
MNSRNDNLERANCYVALELSRSKWLVGALLPGRDQVATISVSGGDTDGLLAALSRLVAKADDLGYPDARLRVCFEAGYDGFWLARFLIDRGIDTTVLDASSFLVSRRGRRVKIDRIDVESMAFVLKAYLLGDKSVCRPVRIPSPEEEDAKRITRERAQLLPSERKCRHQVRFSNRVAVLKYRTESLRFSNRISRQQNADIKNSRPETFRKIRLSRQTFGRHQLTETTRCL